MVKSLKFAFASALLSLGLVAAPAVADPINGQINVTGSVCPSCLPTIPSTSIVSALTTFTAFNNTGTVGALASLDFAAVANALAGVASWAFAGPYPNIITVGGFTFDLNGAGAPVVGAFACNGSGTTYTCSDGLTTALSGIVSGNGFTPTAFTGTLSLSGSCASENGTQCTTGGNYGGSYTYSISATGQPAQVPEPATLALVALGLLGLGLRRKAS